MMWGSSHSSTLDTRREMQILMTSLNMKIRLAHRHSQLQEDCLGSKSDLACLEDLFPPWYESPATTCVVLDRTAVILFRTLTLMTRE